MSMRMVFPKPIQVKGGMVRYANCVTGETEFVRIQA